jgi:D-amino-acid oxidase
VPKVEVTVLGTGVIGLMTARLLQDRGSRVTLVSREHPSLTTSSAACGIMLPTFPFPPESEEFARRIRWQEITLKYLRSYEHGRFLGTARHTEFFSRGSVEGQVPADVMLSYVNVKAPGVVRLKSPIMGFDEKVSIEINVFPARVLLKHLYEEVLEHGAEHRIQEVDADFLNDPNGVIFNCSGYWAGGLCHDREVTGVFGQAVRFPPVGDVFSVGLGDYFARSAEHELYVGAPFIPGVTDPRPQTEQYSKLVRFARNELALFCEAAGVRYDPARLRDPVETVAGIRPFRKTGVRIEATTGARGMVVHNYGHGAHGWTVSWGAVVDTVDLWEAMT